MATRMYLVDLKRKKVLVEATSQEAAVRTATKSMVRSVTIPTPLEVARMMREGTVEVITADGPAPAADDSSEQPQGEGAGRLGLSEAGDKAE